MESDAMGARRLSRRSLLIGAGAAGAALVMAGAASAAAPGRFGGVRALSFENAWTGEKLKVTYYESGRYISGAMAALDRLMRDHVNEATVEMDPRLYDILADLRTLMGSSEPYLLISGYRSPATNSMLAAKSRGVAKNSYHLRGWAADVRLPGRDLRQLALGAISLKRGGVGMYSRKSNFIHVDSGPVRKWNI